MKRFTYWPQIGLGLAFSWGALMGWAAAFGRLDPPAYLLYAGAIAWVIGYDTIYAHQDREDDALIGVKSTALLFGARTKPMLAVFYALAVVLIALAGWSAGAGVVFALGACSHSPRISPGRSTRLDIDDPVSCLAVFKSNRDAGLILFAGLVLQASIARYPGYIAWPRAAVAACAKPGPGHRRAHARCGLGRRQRRVPVAGDEAVSAHAVGLRRSEPYDRHAHDLRIEQHRRARLVGREEAGRVGRPAGHQDVHGHAACRRAPSPSSPRALRAPPWRRHRR